MRDPITLGLVSGLIGNIAKDVSNYLIWRAGGTELTYAHFAASAMTAPEKTREAGNVLAGQMADMTMGAALGIPLVYLLKKTGKDYHLVKGAGMGLLLWGTLYSISPNLGILSIKPKMPRTNLTALWNNLLYGITTAQAAVAMADPGVFPENGETKIEH